MDDIKVKFVKTTSEKLNSGEVQDTLQEDYPGAIIHTHDDNGDDQLYIGEDRITDNLNVGDEDLNSPTLKINSLEASTVGELSRKTISQIILDMVRPVSVTSVTLNKSTHQFEVNGTVTLTATVKPDDAVNKTVTWTTSDSTVATVTSTGRVTARKVGTATITAKAGGKSATCIVTVVPTPPSTDTQPSASISYSGDKLITVGSNLPLESAITATINDGKWTGSENENVPYAGGHSIELSITKDGTPVEFGGVAEEGTYTISGVVTFTPGGSPMDNDNPPTEYPAYPGDTINTNTITVKVIYPIYINGYLTREVDDGEDITAMRRYVFDYNDPQELEITIPDETYSERLAIYVPYEFSELHLYKYDPIRSDINENDPPESWTVNYIPNETTMIFVDDEISEYPGYGKYIKDIEVDSSYSGKALYKIIFEK